jgi:hypothetical protein
MRIEFRRQAIPEEGSVFVVVKIAAAVMERDVVPAVSGPYTFAVHF